MTTAAAALAAAFRDYEAGRLAKADALCRQVLLLQPKHPEALYLAGIVAFRQGHPAAAVDLIGQAIAQNRKAPHYHAGIGMAYRALGQTDAAAKAYRRALVLDPRYADAHLSLGRLQEAAGDDAAAAQSFRRAVACDPNYAEAHFTLATSRHRSGDTAAAAESYRRALALRPDYAEAHNNLGALLRAQGELGAAAQSFRRALALSPTSVEAQVNLGNALLEAGRIGEAIACSRRALALAPDSAAGHSDLIFNLNFDDAIDAAAHQAERRRWDERHARPLAALPPRPRDRDPERRLRIGYVSANFRSYAASYAFGGVLTHHDPAQVEVTCYSDTRQEDAVTALFRAHAGRWRDTAGAADEAVARLVAEDEIDILVDLVGHMVGQRLLVFARRPAPLQVTAWGEPTGTGLAAMDYLFADPVLVPPAERPLLAERVIDLPAALGYWTPEPLPEPGPLPALANGHITFGSFNRRAKITAAVVACWAEILHALPDARLVLKNKIIGQPEQQAELRAAFAVAGVAPERLDLLGQTDRAAHFAAYRAIDIALDPFPHSGGMTTLDALAMGLPVVAKTGATIISRLAASCLAALDLAAFIAPDGPGYVARAVALARDRAALAEWRRDLPLRLRRSTLGDSARYARAVEDSYRAIWRTYCAAATAGDRMLR